MVKKTASVMGCGGSKDDSTPRESKTNNINSTITTTNGKLHQDKLKLDDVNSKTAIDSPSPIELTQDDQILHKVAEKNGPTFSAPKATKQEQSPKSKKGLTNDSSGVSKAWASSQNPPQNEQVNFVNDNDDDSEFGREGIDFCSESFDGIRKKSSGRRKDSITREMPSDEPRSPPDLPRLAKKHSEEPFDPRALIDVDKFKAVNAPATKVKIVNNNNTVTIETMANVVQPEGQMTSVVSPPNFQDFYDEDEKELMASIEQDFVATALPGVVT